MVGVAGIAVVVVSMAALVGLAAARRRSGHEDGSRARAWVSAHHWAVAAIALTGLVAALVPADAFGSPDPSDPWGGYAGRWVQTAVLWTVMMLPVTVTARIVTVHARRDAVRGVTAALAWVLLVAAGWWLLHP